MATLYADFDLTTGGNTGVDATNAWQSLADVVSGGSGTAPAAGDTVLCKGTDTLSATVAWTLAGSGTSRTKLIGVNSSWVNDGTMAIIDGNGGAFTGVTLNNADNIYWENIRVTNCGTTTSHDGISCITSGSYYMWFHNCRFDNNAGNGFDGGGGLSRYSLLTNCRFDNNGLYGATGFRYSCWFWGCRADNNSSRGFNGYGSGFARCIAHDNGAQGIYVYACEPVFDCVAHGNTSDGIRHTYGSAANAVIGCRSTLNSIGVSGNTTQLIPLLYYYGDANTTDGANYQAGPQVTMDGTDTDYGYNDLTTDAEDFSLATGATGYQWEVEIP